jgi:hypothetical protein
LRGRAQRAILITKLGGNPPDTSMIPVSRTIDADSIVDEVIFRFTHTSTIDWMLPGIAPTGRTVEAPLVAIVQFVDGNVAHEHIYWDQASVRAGPELAEQTRCCAMRGEAAMESQSGKRVIACGHSDEHEFRIRTPRRSGAPCRYRGL